MKSLLAAAIIAACAAGAPQRCGPLSFELSGDPPLEPNVDAYIAGTAGCAWEIR